VKQRVDFSTLDIREDCIHRKINGSVAQGSDFEITHYHAVKAWGLALDLLRGRVCIGHYGEGT
jgi:hypothetical protein